VAGGLHALEPESVFPLTLLEGEPDRPRLDLELRAFDEGLAAAGSPVGVVTRS